ncbi:MAG: RNA polymerase subunit sigma-70 [Streptosporangiaceae bacterium]
MTPADALLQRAQLGDGQAFAELVEPHRRELHVHCYRMLGSFDDADDALQETLLAGWRGLAAFHARASVRTWLYRIATNTCLNLRRTAARRPQPAPTLPAAAPAPTGSESVTWLQPYPDALLDSLPDHDLNPEARAVRDEAVSLAFISTLQLLSPRARAVLILRDVLSFSAREVASTIGSTEEAVAMNLSRARASLRDQTRPALSRDLASESALARRLTAAFTAHDVGTVVSLLTEDVRIAMPPQPALWEGRRVAARFLAEVAFRLVPQARYIQTRANRQPALAIYARDAATGRWQSSGLLVITVAGDQAARLTRFEVPALRAFGLPPVLPDDDLA